MIELDLHHIFRLGKSMLFFDIQFKSIHATRPVESARIVQPLFPYLFKIHLIVSSDADVIERKLVRQSNSDDDRNKCQ